MKVEVAFLPSTAIDLDSKLCIVVDVLRATSTLVTMFEAGARKVILSDSITSALDLAGVLADRPIVCGERGGLPPEGFDRGNSPREFLTGSVRGQDLLFCTSNGTRAMLAVAGSPIVLAGSMLNGSTVARSALRQAAEHVLDVAVVCSGDFLGTRFAIDDAFCAGYLVTLLLGEARASASARSIRDAGVGVQDSHPELDESALAAIRVYRSYFPFESSGTSAAPSKDVILEAFFESHNAQVLKGVGLAEDVEFCAQLDISVIVPRLRAVGHRLELVAEHEG